MNLIRNLATLSKSDSTIAGGKGAHLGELLRAGIPVPAGFVILTAAYDRFLEEAGFSNAIELILNKVNYRDMQTVKEASDTIRSLILNTEIPEDLEVLIESEFNALGKELVAVRSSATAEDGLQASWAGELDSFLNITKETLMESVRLCWASLFTPRAIYYRLQRGLDKDKISVAVIVQKMVRSEISGIAFSVHPVTKDINQLIIEAGYGLGEAIVSGSVTPDSYVINKTNLSIIDRQVARQTRKLTQQAGGGSHWMDVLEDHREQQKLSNKRILELAQLVIHIERHFGYPCDIEWAVEDDMIYIVQSRPITTLEGKTPFN